MRVERRRAYILSKDHPISKEVGWSFCIGMKMLILIWLGEVLKTIVEKMLVLRNKPTRRVIRESTHEGTSSSRLQAAH